MYCFTIITNNHSCIVLWNERFISSFQPITIHCSVRWSPSPDSTKLLSLASLCHIFEFFIGTISIKSLGTLTLFSQFPIICPPSPQNVVSDQENKRNDLQRVSGAVWYSFFCRKYCFQGEGGWLERKSSKLKKKFFLKES